MNTVTNASSSYYTANVDKTTENGPCVAMTPYGVIGLERVIKCFMCNRTVNFAGKQVSDQQVSKTDK